MIVQRNIRAALDCLADKPWQVISLCAGNGRDLLGVLSAHPCRADARGLLAELDADIAQSESAPDWLARLTCSLRNRLRGSLNLLPLLINLLPLLIEGALDCCLLSRSRM
jgi:hypothetical protein